MAEHKKAHRADDKRRGGSGDNVVHVARNGTLGVAKGTGLASQFHAATVQNGSSPNGSGKRAR